MTIKSPTRAKKFVTVGCILLIFAYFLARQVSGSGNPSPIMAQSNGSPSPVVNPENAKQMAAMRSAGLHSDPTYIGSMIKVLTNPPHPDYKKTALHALARLGAVEALPSVDATILNSDSDTKSYARVARARLLAEDEAKNVADTAKASVKLNRFYHELGLTPKDVNEAVLQHYVRGGTSDGPQPVEVYAMREIADMIYQGPYKNFTTLPIASQVNFQNDYPSELKASLAPLNSSERVQKLVQELAHKSTLGTNDYYDMQLAADEGISASQAVATQLHVMDANRNQYTQEGFTALLQVLHGIGDKKQAPFFAHFMAAANVEFMYPDVKNGVPQQIVPGY